MRIVIEKLMKNKKMKKEWTMWINASTKTISMTEIPNSKKKVFESEQERVEFGAMLAFKGYKIRQNPYILPWKHRTNLIEILCGVSYDKKISKNS